MSKFPHLPFFHVSKITLSIGVFIIISASFMRQVVDFFEVKVGKGNVIVLISLMLVISALALFIFVIKNSSNFTKTLMFVIVLIIGLAFAWQMKIPVEKIHILEYGVLGWFVARDLIYVRNKFKGAFLACIFSIVVGILDELFQAALPYRYFDIRDIMFNGLGGGWGIILFLLS